MGTITYNSNIPTPSNGFNIKIDLTYEQDKVNNKTKITKAVGYVKRLNSSYYPYNTTSNCVLQIHGIKEDNTSEELYASTTHPSFNLGSDGYKTVLDITPNLEIAHLANGSKKIGVYFMFDGCLSQYYPYGSLLEQYELPTIPRASTIGVLDANIGATTIISIAKADASFKTTLKYKASGQSSYTTIVDKTSQETYPWTVPDSFYSLIPNSKTITCEFIAEAYSGDDLIGTSEPVTATFTAVNAPIIYSISCTDSNDSTLQLTGVRTTMVRYKSNVIVRVTTEAQNETTINSVTVNGVTCTLFYDNIYQATFNSASVNTFEIVVTDSRGNTAKETKTMSVVEYIPLTLNASAGRTSATEDKVKLKFSGNYFIGNFGADDNTLSVKYRVLQSSSVVVGWTALSVTPANNKYSAETELSGFNYNEAYTLEVQASDKLVTTTIAIRILKSDPTFAYGEDWFDVYADTTIDGQIYMGGNKVLGFVITDSF